MERISYRKILIFLLITGFIVRLCFIFILKNQFYFDDEFEYFKMVKNFLSGKGLIVAENLKSFRPPLYPFIISIFYLLNLNLIGVRIFQVLLSTFSIYIIYLIGKETFDEKIALISSCISTFYPYFIFYNGFLLTETTFIFLTLISILYLIKNFESNGKISFKSGIFIGLSGLTRPTFQLYLPISILHIYFSKEKRRFKKILFIFGGFSLAISPWIIRNYKIFHEFIPGTTMGGWVFWEGNNPYSDGGPCSYFPEKIFEIEELQRDKLLYKMTFKVIKENPKRFLWLLKNKFKRFWNIVPNAPEFEKKVLYRLISVFSFGIMMPFFIVGFFVSLKNKKAQFFHSLIILFTIFHMIFLASIRYRIFLEPFYIIFSVYGFFYIMLIVKSSFGRIE